MRTRMLQTFAAPLLLALGASLAGAQDISKSPVSSPASRVPAPGTSEPWTRVDAAITAAIAKQSISGLSVAAVLDNRVAWSRGYGLADLENSVPFTATTVWRLGSISKPITAVAAMQLSEQGKLDLEVPIQNYCPAFPKKAQPITSRHLLGHLSGIRHYKEDENFNSTRHFATISESLETFKADPLLREPGAAYGYSTYGYVVLGCVVEGTSGSSFADYIREHVTKPAGMDRTRPDDLYAIVPNRARGYSKGSGGEFRNADLADTSNKIPGGGFVSTAVDLGQFAIALHTNRLLKAETFRQMQVPMKTNDGKDSPYFGWSIVDRKGEKMLTHSGGQQGTSTYLLMIPSKGFALAFLTNTERVDVGAIAREVADILLP